ncbi:unnamed protein product [Eruca vesicaria subsp. sativa]|uniref:Uncharacterized protein n=1 Tax=Eruca vesicaria subsp. sativa TaxID=29727 RepID=A0ABC8LIP2_ERUVS|nr:unnamed protein product [Eruca vesicaria subsp. sativa]
MKFGKEFSSQMVPEWHEAYMDYEYLKSLLKDITKFKRKNNPHHSQTLRRKLTVYRTFSGLLAKSGRKRHPHGNAPISPFSDSEDDIEEGLKSAPILVHSASHGYETTFLMAAEAGGEYETVFFRRLDDEFNKVEKFYKEKVDEVMKEAVMLNKQMDALIAFRVKVEHPDGWQWKERTVEMTRLASDVAISAAAVAASTPAGARSMKLGAQALEAIHEGGSSSTGKSDEDEDDDDEDKEKDEEKVIYKPADGDISRLSAARPSPIQVLDRVKFNNTKETPRSTIKHVLKPSNPELKFSRDNLRKVEEKLRRAFVEFYQKLRLLKSYSFLNVLAFSKIMKKYDKVSSRNATKSYMKMVDNSYLGGSDEVIRLMERVEDTFIKHFTNANRTKGMNILRPKAKRERHRITFSTGFLGGCMFSLVVALFAIIRTRNILQEDGQKQYMNTMFPLYSLFGFIVLHILMYAANIYYWTRYRVNYSFIFGFKQGTELRYRQVLLVGFSIGVLALLCVIANLDMEVDPETNDYKALTELLPLILLICLFIVLVLPFNIFYRSSRLFFLTCLFHCLAAPLYKVTLPDFLLGDQLTSQVQALRSVQFYICHYGWGDYKLRQNTCTKSDTYNAFLFIVAVVPYVCRLLQCLRRLFEEKNAEQGYNGIKYFLTIVAVCLRTAYSVDKDNQFLWRLLAGIFSAIAAIFCTYWDLVLDWGLLNRTSKNRWLRDKLLIPQKKVYFIAMTVLDFNFSFMHRQTMVAVVASLEIIRRGIWNFFRLENEHLNNVGKYRAFKTGFHFQQLSTPQDHSKIDTHCHFHLNQHINHQRYCDLSVINTIPISNPVFSTTLSSDTETKQTNQKLKDFRQELMKFGKEFSSQMVPEWHEAYMDYNHLKSLLKDIVKFKREHTPPHAHAQNLHRKLTIYRTFSGLISNSGRKRHPHGASQIGPFSDSDDDIEEGLNSAPILVHSASHGYETTFLMAAEEGGEYETVFFRRLDDEFNKVEKFYKEKVDEVMKEAVMLNKQMDALIAFRVKVEHPDGWLWEERTVEMTRLASDVDISAAAVAASTPAGARSMKVSAQTLEAIQEGGSSKAGKSDEDDDDDDEDKEKQEDKVISDDTSRLNAARPSSIEVLDRVRINNTKESPRSTIKHVLKSLNPELKFSRDNLRKVEEKLRRAFVEFYQKLRLLKSYSFLNVLAFSKILKKYDKVTTRNAAKPYMKMVDNSYLGGSDEVTRLMERVEATFIKHFTNANRTKGMNILRPQAKREKHRITFSTGFLGGCMFSLVVALFAIIRTRNILQENGHKKYMNTMFPLYSLFGFIVLHILMYAANIYYWRRYRVNYSFIFGFKQATELSYRRVLLVGFSIGVLALLCVIANLDMEVDPETNDYKALTELLPLFLLIVMFIVLVLPFNIFYRSSRLFFLTCLFHCLAAPLYKVTLPDFLLGDQLTSQVQALRSVQFYICHYGWGDYKLRKNTCTESDTYNAFLFIVAVVPYVCRLLQCLRRLFEEKNAEQGYNGIKYFLTIVAVCLRTAYSIDKDNQFLWRLLAGIFSAIAAIFCTYWDLVLDWGLLNRTSKNRWLRDKLLIPQKKVYFIAMILNVLLRFAWVQTVLDFNFSFMHKQTMVALVASLEIIRRGIWNFFRLENEHLNNVGKYRAFKTVPLPFNYDEDDDKDN